MRRKEIFENGGHYHICNQGIDKRNITSVQRDSARFMESLVAFNTEEPIGSIYEQIFEEDKAKKRSKPLVRILAYCLNPNHFHLLLEQLVDKGISVFMSRLCGGYAYYFNKKYKRSGSLFKSRFKARHITDNNDLLHASAYVNLNDKVHQLGAPGSKLVRNSWHEYLSGNKNGICKNNIILEQFSGPEDYEIFALESLELMLERKRLKKEEATFELGDI